jgi:glycosyltransferase involved in cell wall biosynthesis
MNKILAKQFWGEEAPTLLDNLNSTAKDKSLARDHKTTFFDVSGAPARSGTIAILLGAYNGERFLAKQLESIAFQSYPQWKVWASDDGSEDGTYAILERHRAEWGDECLSILRGPAQGFVANFLSLVCNTSIQADYYAYADQDDIWDVDKLSRATRWLDALPKNTPALHCSRTRLVDANNQDFGFSPLFTKVPGFANALVQNIAGGNTMVFNDAARRLLLKASKNIEVVSHDWWTYLVITGCGGKVYYDPVPTIRYRQHGTNVIGSNYGWPARIRRVHLLFKGRFRTWTEQHVQALQQIRSQLTPDNSRILDQFASARHRRFVPRLIGMMRSNIYRQTFLGNLGLVVATFFKKI